MCARRGTVTVREAWPERDPTRTDNVPIVVDDLEAVKAFFLELAVKLEGQTTVEGPAIGKLRTAIRMRAHAAEILGEMRYKGFLPPSHIRGPEGIIVGLAKER